MKDIAGTTGLIFNEPLLWEKGQKGRTAFSLPRRDVRQHPVDEDLKGSGPDFPDLKSILSVITSGFPSGIFRWILECTRWVRAR